MKRKSAHNDNPVMLINKQGSIALHNLDKVLLTVQRRDMRVSMSFGTLRQISWTLLSLFAFSALLWLYVNKTCKRQQYRR